MEIIINFCSIVNPLFFVLFGICALIMYITAFYIKYKEIKQFSKIDTKNYTKTTGVIKDYEIEYETKIIKKDGKEQQVQIEKYRPVVEYKIENETYTVTYKRPFFKSIKPIIGYELPVHISNSGDRSPYILYEDIYFNELKGSKITMIFVCGFIIVATITLTIFSVLGQ